MAHNLGCRLFVPLNCAGPKKIPRYLTVSSSLISENSFKEKVHLRALCSMIAAHFLTNPTYFTLPDETEITNATIFPYCSIPH